MNNIRTGIESYFTKLAIIFYRNKFKTLIPILILIGVLASFLGNLTIDTSTESFFHEDDPAMINYHLFRDQFGRDDVIIVAIKPDRLFDGKTLKKIKALHDEIEATVPYIDALTSIINIRDIRGKGDELVVEDLISEWPETKEQLAALKDRVLSNPFYKNTIVSEDGTLTAIIIKIQTYADTLPDDEIFAGFDDGSDNVADESDGIPQEYLSDAQIMEIGDVLEKVCNKYDAPDFNIYRAGSPIAENAVKLLISRDMAVFSTLSIIIIAIFLFVMFRRITGVVIPLVIVIMSMVTMLGMMAAFSVPITIITQILSSFILVVGVGDSVHILAIFYVKFNESGDREKAVGHAMGHSGLAVAMTSLTTAGGFLSFASADIAPVADLGIFAAIGIGAAFVYTVALLPALLGFFPLKVRKISSKKEPFMDSILKGIARISTKKPIAVITISSIILFAAILGLHRLHFSHNMLEWLPEDLDVKKATELVDRELRGSVSLEVIIDTGREKGLYQPEILQKLDASADEIEGTSYGRVFAGKAWSLTSILKEINKALNENRSDFYTIPRDSELIAQEFLLFENSGADDLENVMDSMAGKARFTIKAPFEDAMDYDKFIDIIHAHFTTNYPETTITITGIMALFTKTMYNVMTSAIKSYLIAFAVISLLMFILIGRPSFAALSMIPNLAPIIIILGLMGWLNINLDSSDILIGSIAIGLVVDDTIHFMHNFTRYYANTGNVEISVEQTLITTGRAIMVTSLVLTLGFFIYIFSSMKNIINFGLLTGITIMLALLADFFLASSLVTLAVRKASRSKE